MKLIMRADDLGFSDGVNYGIYKSVVDGVITSVGMMPNMASAKHGYELVKDLDIALGQHSNICVGKPLSDPKLIPSLVQKNGNLGAEYEPLSVDVNLSNTYCNGAPQIKFYCQKLMNRDAEDDAFEVSSEQ